MWDKLAHYLTHQVYKVIEYVCGLFSFVLFQFGVLKDTINFEPVNKSESLFDESLREIVLSSIHGFFSVMVAIMCYFAVHILKRVLENKQSRISKISNSITDLFGNEKIDSQD